jgi:hypothetical protein
MAFRRKPNSILLWFSYRYELIYDGIPFNHPSHPILQLPLFTTLIQSGRGSPHAEAILHSNMQAGMARKTGSEFTASADFQDWDLIPNANGTYPAYFAMDSSELFNQYFKERCCMPNTGMKDTEIQK